MKIDLDYVDSLNAKEFECFTGELLQHLGYTHIKVTKYVDDNGLDVLAIDKNGKRMGVQCKHRTQDSPVTFDAMLEASIGVDYYHLDYAIVLTNGYITKDAFEYPTDNCIRCWNRTSLGELLEKANLSSNKYQGTPETKDILKSYYKHSHISLYKIDLGYLKVIQSMLLTRSQADTLDKIIRVALPILINDPKREKIFKQFMPLEKSAIIHGGKGL